MDTRKINQNEEEKNNKNKHKECAAGFIVPAILFAIVAAVDDDEFYVKWGATGLSILFFLIALSCAISHFICPKSDNDDVQVSKFSLFNCCFKKRKNGYREIPETQTDTENESRKKDLITIV